MTSPLFNGGAFFIGENIKNLEVKRTMFFKCTAYIGGAFFVHKCDTIKIESSCLIQNKADHIDNYAIFSSKECYFDDVHSVSPGDNDTSKSVELIKESHIEKHNMNHSQITSKLLINYASVEGTSKYELLHFSICYRVLQFSYSNINITKFLCYNCKFDIIHASNSEILFNDCLFPNNSISISSNESNLYFIECSIKTNNTTGNITIIPPKETILFDVPQVNCYQIKYEPKEINKMKERFTQSEFCIILFKNVYAEGLNGREGGAMHIDWVISKIHIQESTFVKCEAIYGGIMYAKCNTIEWTTLRTCFRDCKANFGMISFNTAEKEDNTMNYTSIDCCPKQCYESDIIITGEEKGSEKYFFDLNITNNQLNMKNPLISSDSITFRYVNIESCYSFSSILFIYGYSLIRDSSFINNTNNNYMTSNYMDIIHALGGGIFERVVFNGNKGYFMHLFINDTIILINCSIDKPAKNEFKAILNNITMTFATNEHELVLSCQQKEDEKKDYSMIILISVSVCLGVISISLFVVCYINKRKYMKTEDRLNLTKSVLSDFG